MQKASVRVLVRDGGDAAIPNPNAPDVGLIPLRFDPLPLWMVGIVTYICLWDIR